MFDSPAYALLRHSKHVLGITSYSNHVLESRDEWVESGTRLNFGSNHCLN